MPTYPLSGSTLNAQISSGLSTQILVKVGATTVGAIQSLQITENRDLTRIKELGLDGILEIVPNSATTYDARVERIVFDGLRLPEAFARGYINIKSQTVAFDILVIDRSNGEGEGAITHTLKSCWFQNYSPRFQADNYIITESATIWIEDISSNLGTSSESAVQGGVRGIDFDVNARERSTDAGGYRGSMDVSDLLNQVFE